jgi:hypothetical protein
MARCVDVAAQAHLLVPARSAEDVLYRDELETRDPRQAARRAHLPRWRRRAGPAGEGASTPRCSPTSHLDRPPSASSAGRRRSSSPSTTSWSRAGIVRATSTASASDPVEDDYGRPAHRRQWGRRRRRRGRRRRDVPVLRTCQSCGDRRAIGEPRPYRSVGELRLYRSVGVVLRCPACEGVGVVLGVQEKRLVVEWRGSTRSRGDPRPQIQFRPLNWRYSATPRSAMRARASG